MVIFDFFQKNGRLPSCIGFVRVWTTHEEYLVVCITINMWLEIGAVYDMQVLIFNEHGCKMPVHGGYGGISPLNGGQCHRHPPKASPSSVHKSRSYDVQIVKIGPSVLYAPLRFIQRLKYYALQ